MSWKTYPDIKPERSGYYYVKYYNPEMKDVFHKAIWYTTETDKWLAWRKGVEGLVVDQFIAESRHDYYVPCEMWAEENYKQFC